MPNSKDMLAVGTGDARGGGGVGSLCQHIPSTAAHCLGWKCHLPLSRTADETAVDILTDLHHLATLAVAGTCLCYLSTPMHHSHLAIAADELFPVYQADSLSREIGLRKQALGLVKPLPSLGVLLCSDTDGCWRVINVKTDQINS